MFAPGHRSTRERLVVIGVHTPEFAFERNLDNVRRAVRQLRIEYPVAIDNDYAIWRAFDNQYWPALHFLDARGRVRQHHFGEGEYEQSEKVIQRLLAEAGVAGSDAGVVSVDAAAWKRRRTGRTCGLRRTTSATSGRRTSHRRAGLSATDVAPYAAPARLALNQWALAGDWTMGRQATVLNSPNGRIVYRFHARDLHLVMGPPRQGVLRTFPRGD